MCIAQIVIIQDNPEYTDTDYDYVKGNKIPKSKFTMLPERLRFTNICCLKNVNKTYCLNGNSRQAKLIKQYAILKTILDFFSTFKSISKVLCRALKI